MAFPGFNHNLGKSFAKLSEVLTSSVNGKVGLSSVVGLPIAIEFGTGSLKILQVAAGEPPSLVAAACLETPDELMADHRRRLDWQLQALPRLIKQGGFRGKRAVCAIPSWQTLCKHVQFVRSEGVPTPAAVESAISMQLNCDPNSLVYRYLEMGAPERTGKAEVILMAVAREVVEKLMKGIVACKLQPVGMHSEFAATLRAFDYVHKREGDAKLNTLYLDIGAWTTKVMISHGKKLVFTRLIEIGGHHLDTIVSQQLEVDVGEARRMRLALDNATPAYVAPKARAARPVLVSDAAPVGVGVGGAGGVAVAMAAPKKKDAFTEQRGDGVAPGFTPEITAQPPAPVAPGRSNLTEPLETITDEVQMCLRYHAAQFRSQRVERAIFIGGESRHRGLCQHIARALRLPAQMADPMARVARSGQEPALGIDLKQPQPGWSVTLGLCLSPTDL